MANGSRSMCWAACAMPRSGCSHCGIRRAAGCAHDRTSALDLHVVALTVLFDVLVYRRVDQRPQVIVLDLLAHGVERQQGGWQLLGGQDEVPAADRFQRS